MVRNVGGTEKVIRLVVGGYLVLGAFFLDLPTWGTATLSVVGMVALLTGIVGYCPAWTVFGMNTCRTKSNP
ncbi:MAG: DUF2892 domain-containing protein [Nitrospirales bacterium]